MENIRGINPLSAAQAIQNNNKVSRQPDSQSSTAPSGDTVEISFQARVASGLASVPEVRNELIAQVKAEIQAGTYETSDKLDQALNNLLGEL